MYFKKKILKNGMTILFEKRDVPVVSVAFAVKCGGINESISEKGISHFVEHMLFKGTKNRSARDISAEIEKNGGVLNGATTENMTYFWCKMPSDCIEVALDVLTDMIKYPQFDEAEISKERNVIFEEIKMRTDNPRVYILDKIQSLLYSGTLGFDLSGDYKTVGAISKNSLLERFDKTYSPNNLILAVVGDADFDFIVNWCEKNFSDKKSTISPYDFHLKNESLIINRDGIEQANLAFAFHTPLADDPLVYAAEVLLTLMAEGMSSKLFLEIREKRNLAYSINGGLESNKNYSYATIYVGTSSENVEKVKKLILEEFEKVSKNLTLKELDETKKQIIGNYKISMEESQEQMMNLLNYELNLKAENFYEYEKNILDVKLSDVKKLASNVKEGNYSFLALVPKSKK